MGEGRWAPSESIGTSSTDGGESRRGVGVGGGGSVAIKAAGTPSLAGRGWSREMTGSMECGGGDHIDVHPGIVQD
jgi:hypothetical protein